MPHRRMLPGVGFAQTLHCEVLPCWVARIDHRRGGIFVPFPVFFPTNGDFLKIIEFVCQVLGFFVL